MTSNDIILIIRAVADGVIAILLPILGWLTLKATRETKASLDGVHKEINSKNDKLNESASRAEKRVLELVEEIRLAREAEQLRTEAIIATARAINKGDDQ